MQQVKTQNGYLLGEVISALQKEIRRGGEENAMYWALELIPRFEAYLWRRLTVIINEDIGLASPEVFYILPALRAQFFEFRQAGRDGSARLVLANAILYMARAPKSRIADHFQRVSVERWMNGERLDIPDYALDKHTMRGRNLGRKSADFWLDEGCQLANPGEVDDPYQEQAEAYWRAGRNQAPEWGVHGGKVNGGTKATDDKPVQRPPSLFDMDTDF
jgi:hypothetical protein